MSRKEVATVSVGVIVGFILGFFTVLGLQQMGIALPEGVTPMAAQGGDGLPDNHPTAEQMARVQELLQVAEAEKENREVRVHLGNALYDMGRFDAAIPWYEEAIALDPNDVHVQTDLGTAYLYVGEMDKALAAYHRSIEIDPAHGQTLQNLGIAYFSGGDYQKAIDAWERLLESNPGYAQAEDVRRHIQTARLHLTSEVAAP